LLTLLTLLILLVLLLLLIQRAQGGEVTSEREKGGDEERERGDAEGSEWQLR
jgi:hypothetical protein